MEARSGERLGNTGVWSSVSSLGRWQAQHPFGVTKPASRFRAAQGGTEEQSGSARTKELSPVILEQRRPLWRARRQFVYSRCWEHPTSCHTFSLRPEAGAADFGAEAFTASACVRGTRDPLAAADNEYRVVVVVAEGGGGR